MASVRAHDEEVLLAAERVLALAQPRAGPLRARLAALPPVVVRRILRDALTQLAVPLPEETHVLIDGIMRREQAALDPPVVDGSRLVDLAAGQRVVAWRGDITRLRVDAIVNAANAEMLGCFRPDHPCVDNAIHTAAGPRLRDYCRAVTRGRPQPTGRALITPGFNLPARFVLHTVGPIAEHAGHEQPRELASCYTACLDLAAASGVRSVAFCCISAGLYGYPAEAAARVALGAVRWWLQSGRGIDFVVFCVFADDDAAVYDRLLPQVFPGGRLR